MAISSVGSNARPGVCTSTTRPTTPFEGQLIYETDTDMLAIWNGSAWRYIASTTTTNGTVLQVVTGTTTTGATNNTSTYADTNLSASITPKSSSSKVLVMVTQVVGKTNANSENRVQVRLVRGSTALMDTGSLINYTGGAGFDIGECSILFLDSPTTTASITYRTQFMNPQNTAAANVQYGGGTSTIVLMEIAG